jgi:putative SOS response-associated peptidase YedK
MCGRFTATFEFSEIRVRWNLEDDLQKRAPRFNVAPETSPNIPVIVRHRGSNECRLMRWGLIPSWAKDPTIGNQTINARVESLIEKPAFKHLLATRRCIIPADGFYEWRKEGKRKVPMWVHLKNKEPFAFAGLWDIWRNPGGKRVESFTIITTEPNELVRPVHNRMPAILRPEDEEQWLDASRIPFAKAKSVLKPYPDELLDAHDVSQIVNSAKYDGPEFIRPVADDEIPSGRQLSLL